MLRDADIGPNHIVFVHANDLWLVGRDGGDALRLTSSEGAETSPTLVAARQQITSSKS
jgi:tricorn protease